MWLEILTEVIKQLKDPKVAGGSMAGLIASGIVALALRALRATRKAWEKADKEIPYTKLPEQAQNTEAQKLDALQRRTDRAEWAWGALQKKLTETELDLNRSAAEIGALRAELETLEGLQKEVVALRQQLQLIRPDPETLAREERRERMAARERVEKMVLPGLLKTPTRKRPGPL